MCRPHSKCSWVRVGFQSAFCVQPQWCRSEFRGNRNRRYILLFEPRSSLFHSEIADNGKRYCDTFRHSWSHRPWVGFRRWFRIRKSALRSFRVAQNTGKSVQQTELANSQCKGQSSSCESHLPNRKNFIDNYTTKITKNQVIGDLLQ